MIILFVIILAAAVIIEHSSLTVPTHLVKYHCVASKRSVEPGETFELITTVENQTGKTIPFLQTDEYFPHSLAISGHEDAVCSKTDFSKYTHRIFLKKGKRIHVIKQAVINKRGVFPFGQAELLLGDFLGIRDRKRPIIQTEKIIVFPKRLNDSRLEQVLCDVCDNIIVQSFINPDPMLIRGYRSYTGCEPMKSISFSQSAKYDDLMVKEYDHTNKEIINIILDASFVGSFDEYFDNREAVFSLARTICEGFEEKQLSYRLIMNSYYEHAENYGVNVMESSGNGATLINILEALGAASGITCHTEELIKESFVRYGREKEFIFISLTENAETLSLLKSLQTEYGTQLYTLYGADYTEEKAC